MRDERLPDSADPRRPGLNPRFRLQWEEAQQAWVLLYPEGMVKLNGSAGEIMTRCDGVRSVGDIVADLEAAFGEADLAPDVAQFFQIASQQGWLQWT
ncbi:Coenzyme PQQ synthesis protein D [Thiomonas arsenitoxydans]|uniref:Coenzyme PQQ synthesis protein D n=1 Tax=Thiomonas arsenitoxydans (strain DSM 22701 / CIP 110005 / 3As) TaxID=426114 RepID=D6CRJ6_THIA3|nr:pyrroloquinoline quinone biosynthesis peptide chaperone PqqD [Thiomonas arsenitoxydans]MDE2462293.1 pyrroloquinoline quinone biosynthesis peptide chaperone PqqD [Alphaproteobacteria bacterium]MBN8745758.1 pyrroloquinoline quinone biosynthesis peptide chaperone PqqD [Thiomonas arsenitoxydans]CAZ87237.1 coenzyme PQQ synthesis protein D [Thiomonas arsenitoxydans]CQR29118.1 Coenzyme PQQ synthesis protein D [Thiomonas arsenitoxydans]CQR30171.1 Coenzyme PQQ synthesis protein D [Thiomonas arsenito